MQRRKDRGLLDRVHHPLIDQHGLSYRAAAVDDAMGHGVEVVQVARLFRSHPGEHVPRGGFMGVRCDLTACHHCVSAAISVAGAGSDILDLAAGQAFTTAAGSVDFDQFELQRRTAAVEDQDAHRTD